MSRVRFMSPYLKGGRDTGKLVNRARYIATRPGVEVLRDEHGDQPATSKQQAYVQRLLRDFPGAEELLEYEDYRNAPTQANANTFIRQVQEDFAEPMSRMENYLDYVSHRPGVQLDGEHGLWCAEGKVRNLSLAVREVAEHTGSVWTPVVAIRREDAERLGYSITWAASFRNSPLRILFRLGCTSTRSAAGCSGRSAWPWATRRMTTKICE